MDDSVRDTRLDAVVGLVDDASPPVALAAVAQLERYARAMPERVRAAIERAAPRQRVVARGVVERLRIVDFKTELARIGAGPGDLADLERGALGLATWRYPELDPRAVTDELDRIAALAAPSLPSDRAPRATWSALREVLFGELGFAGNVHDYYAPDNSYLNRVLETRRGIPISLSTVVLLVARRLGVPMAGIGMPFHFLVEISTDRGILLDPFHAGRVLTRDDCEELCRGMGHPFRDAFLDPVPAGRILARSISNLVGIYERADQPARARRLVELARVLDSPTD